MGPERSLRLLIRYWPLGCLQHGFREEEQATSRHMSAFSVCPCPLGQGWGASGKLTDSSDELESAAERKGKSDRPCLR